MIPGFTSLSDEDKTLWVEGLSCRPDICVSWYTSELGVGLGP